MVRMNDAAHIKRELIIFLLINLGISLIWRGAIALSWLVKSELYLQFLSVIGCILILNFYRAFAVPKLRILYAVTAVLNVLANVAAGQTGFLISLDRIDLYGKTLFQM